MTGQTSWNKKQTYVAVHFTTFENHLAETKMSLKFNDCHRMLSFSKTRALYDSTVKCCKHELLDLTSIVISNVLYFQWLVINCTHLWSVCGWD